MKSIADFEPDELFIGMRVISANGKPGAIVSIDYDYRLTESEGPIVDFAWDDGTPSGGGWWSRQIKKVVVTDNY